MNFVIVRIHIRAEEMLRFYTGTATEVVTTTEDGRSIRFPVKVLRPFVTESGVAGRFLLRFDARNRFVDAHRLRTR